MPDDLRERLSRALDPERRGTPGLSPLNRVLLAAIGLSILLAVLQSEPLIAEGRAGLFLALEAALGALFAVEYLARFWVAPLNPRHKSGWHWALRPAALLDLAVVLSFLLPVLGIETALLRLLRVLRLVRLARLGRFSVAMTLLGEALSSRREELAISVIFAGVLLLLSSTLLYLVEGAVQPGAFGSIPRAMWWSVATLTTVGYGDVVPVTVLGRALAALTALTGIGLIALPAGILAGAFSDALRTARERREKAQEARHR